MVLFNARFACTNRCTPCVENFSDTKFDHCAAIKSEGKIYSAASNAQIPIVCVADIAEVAIEVLMGRQPLHGQFYPVFGPRSVTVDEVNGP